MEARHKFIIRRLKNFFWCYYFLTVIKKDFWLNNFFFSNTIKIFYTVPVRYVPVLRSWSRLELPLLVWSWQWSQFFCWPEPRAGAAFFQVAPAASFLPSKKESLVVVTKRDIRAIFYGKCDPK